MPDSGDIARMKRIVARVRARGVKVIYVNKWYERGYTFPVVPNATFVHHDASSSRSGTWGAIGIITYGRKGVPAPLSQFQVARGGTPQLAVVAAGIANHAGTGGPLRGLPQDNANRETYGMEVANNGIDEKYSDATLYAIQVLQASILEEIDEPVSQCIGHKEWTDRKPDPKYSMNWMRDLVSKIMQGEVDDMSDQQYDAIMAAIADARQDLASRMSNFEMRVHKRLAAMEDRDNLTEDEFKAKVNEILAELKDEEQT